MPSILIADACKPSVVMTSEIFKDKIPGISILVADSGRAALEVLSEQIPDLCVVDFDLPDVDGPALVETMRKTFNGPILMTAFPDSIVDQAVAENLFTYTDASNWLSKPVEVSKMSAVIDKFLTEGHRINKRFESNLATQLVAKASGRGKRAPKVSGNIINMSVGGVCVKLSGNMKLKKQQELTMTLNLPIETVKDRSQKAANTTSKKTTSRKSTELANDIKIKAKVAWVTSGCIGVQFGRLSDLQKKGLLDYLRVCDVLEADQ